MDNTKEENFKRLAEKRTQKIIDTLQLLGNLSNTSNYSYTDKQVEHIFGAIESELKIQRAKFRKTGNKKSFKL